MILKSKEYKALSALIKIIYDLGVSNGEPLIFVINNNFMTYEELTYTVIGLK